MPLTRGWNAWISAGRGFETPTINELSYRSDGATGLNLGLKPATSDTLEIGSKKRIGNGLISAALFQTDTRDEIVADASSGGRTTYKNAGQTRRRGLELSFGSAVCTGLAAEDGLHPAGCALSQQRLRQ